MKFLSYKDKMAFLQGKSYSGMTLTEFHKSPAHTAMYRQTAKDLNMTLFAACGRVYFVNNKEITDKEKQQYEL